MGSASGRRKCCQFYYDRGYDEGFKGYRNSGRPLDAPWEELELFHASGTISKSLAGLWRNGFDEGRRDQRERQQKEKYAYYNYTWKRKGLQDVLRSLDWGFKLEYSPNGGWPRHPFTLSSETGGTILRRTTKDLRLAHDYADNSGHRSAIHRELCKLPSEARDRREADKAAHRVKL